MAPILNYLAGALVAFASTAVAVDEGDASILTNEIARANNQSLLWGPYRPNLYFGVRPRIPKSFMGGLMWARVDDFQSVQHSKFFLCNCVQVGVTSCMAGC